MEYAGEETLVRFWCLLDGRDDLEEGRKAKVRHELLRQLVDAVAHVHSRGVVFRDLKHENVVVRSEDDDLGDARLTLVDFDARRRCDERNGWGINHRWGHRCFRRPRWRSDESTDRRRTCGRWGCSRTF